MVILNTDLFSFTGLKKSENSISGANSSSHTQSSKMTNIPLSSKVSSLFDIPERRELHAHGSSITSFAWEPKDEDHRRVKKVRTEPSFSKHG